MKTKNSFLNFISSFIPWIILAIFGFIKIKFFIKYYGSELNGLIQLTHQIFVVLSAISMGFGSAIIYNLYKPLVHKNFQKVSELFVGSKKIFKTIGIIIFIGGLIASITAPFIISNLKISKIYVFLIFLLYALDYLSMYFIVAPYKTLLEADQKKYIVNIVINFKHLIFRIMEIFLIIKKIDILLIISSSIITNIVANLYIRRIVRKKYKWLNLNVVPDLSPKEMTKDVFAHRINKVIFQNTDSILLSLTKGLQCVSIYGSYNYILQFAKQLITYIFKAPQASFGHIFANENKNPKSKYDIFNEYLSLSFYFALIAVPIFIISISNFISIWINEDYVLSNSIIVSFGITLWYEFILAPFITIVESTGNFKKTKKIVIIASILNILISLTLVNFYGILGVLVGTILSQAFIYHLYYVNFVYKHILKQKVISYYKKYIIALIILIIIISINQHIIFAFNLYSKKNLTNWLLNTSFLTLFYIFIITFVFCLFYKSFNKLIYRFISYLKKN